MTMVLDNAIERITADTGEKVYFVPTLITSLIYTSDPFFSRSFHSYENILEEITTATIADSSWSAYHPTKSVKKATITAISSDKAMIARVTQALSDMVSNRK